MSGDWDSYFCHIDGKPASIFVDLSLADAAPLTAFPFMAYLSVTLQQPDEHGLPVQEEYERLCALEERLEGALTANAQAVYAGSATRAGRCDFFFYLRSEEGWGTRAVETLSLFPEYACETGTQCDPAWETYRCFLFPDSYALHGIQNRRALEKLREQGDDLEQSREIEHWALFFEEGAAGAFIQAIRDRDFALLSGPVPAPIPEDSVIPPETEFSVRFSRPDAPEGIDELICPLIELALAHGGAYQGWACPVAL